MSMTELQEKLIQVQEQIVTLNAEGVELTPDQEEVLGAMMVEQSELIEKIKTFLHKIG